MRGVKPHIEIDRGALLDMPPTEWLSDDAKAEWRRTFPILAKRKILTEADLGGLENYCMAVGLAREMERDIQKNGAVQKVYKIDNSGSAVLVSVRKNPAVSIQSDAMTRARLLAAELCCTPVSRSRPTVEDSDGDDDLWSWGN